MITRTTKKKQTNKYPMYCNKFRIILSKSECYTNVSISEILAVKYNIVKISRKLDLTRGSEKC